MKIYRALLLLLALGLLSASVGCSGNVHIKGRVTYPNGQPLTIGQVIFTDDFYLGRSDLDKNGEYSIHTFGRNDGMKKGIYRAYITSAFRFEKQDEIPDKIAPYRFDKPILLIDIQHTNPDTSGWVFDIQKDSTIDFVVYPPNEVPEDKKTEAAKMLFDEEYRKKVERQKALEKGEDPTKIHKKKRTVNPLLL